MSKKNWRCETRLYGIWKNMKDRCNRPGNRFYQRYGGRGIKVCKEWANNFYVFEEWAYSHGYREYLTIDRIDNDKGYSPDNCRWSSQSSQMRNTSKSIFLTINGEKRNINEWSEMTGLSVETIRRRRAKGDTGQNLIRPLYQVVNPSSTLYEIDGIEKSAKEWAKEIGISPSAFYVRWRQGKRGSDLSAPNRNKHSVTHTPERSENNED